MKYSKEDQVISLEVIYQINILLYITTFKNYKEIFNLNIVKIC